MKTQINKVLEVLNGDITISNKTQRSIYFSDDTSMKLNYFHQIRTILKMAEQKQQGITKSLRYHEDKKEELSQERKTLISQIDTLQDSFNDIAKEAISSSNRIIKNRELIAVQEEQKKANAEATKVQQSNSIIGYACQLRYMSYVIWNEVTDTKTFHVIFANAHTSHSSMMEEIENKMDFKTEYLIKESGGFYYIKEMPLDGGYKYNIKRSLHLYGESGSYGAPKAERVLEIEAYLKEEYPEYLLDLTSCAKQD